MVENLEGTGEIQETHVVMESDEHLDGLEVLIVTNCTHLADCIWEMIVWIDGLGLKGLSYAQNVSCTGRTLVECNAGQCWKLCGGP